MILTQELVKKQNTIYKHPNFDIDKMIYNTKKSPEWIHFGAGNIFRAFLANAQQKMLNRGLMDRGIIVAEGFDYELIDYLKKYDNLTINVTLKSNGEIEKDILASVAEYLKMKRDEDDFIKLVNYFENPSLQFISLTITEKGYKLSDSSGNYFHNVKNDFESGPNGTESYLGKLVSLLYKRFKSGPYPLAIVSMDNMSRNGETLENSIMMYAKKWVENNLVESEFLRYLNNKNYISFPWTMIDKITPRPSTQIAENLEQDGFEEIQPITTSRNTYVAPFVNGEETEYLVIEDSFPNGRPPLQEVGIIFTDRSTVHLIETMKVTTCLNPLHTGLAIFGCLLGYHSIADEMKDVELLKLINRIGYQEGLPVVKDPIIIDPKTFLDEVIMVRLPNKFIPDTPQRIITDTSQKMSVRFGETLKKYLNEEKNLEKLVGIPLVIAGWLRYLQGTNDKLEKIEQSPDPLLEEIENIFSDQDYDSEEHLNKIDGLLSRKEIFGVDLVQIGLSNRIKQYYMEMNQGTGSVRRTLEKFLV